MPDPGSIKLNIEVEGRQVGTIVQLSNTREWNAVFDADPDAIGGTGNTIDEAIENAFKNGRDSYRQMLELIDTIEQSFP